MNDRHDIVDACMREAGRPDLADAAYVDVESGLWWYPTPLPDLELFAKAVKIAGQARLQLG